MSRIKIFNKKGFKVIGFEGKYKKGTVGYLWKKQSDKINRIINKIFHKNEGFNRLYFGGNPIDFEKFETKEGFFVLKKDGKSLDMRFKCNRYKQI